MLKDARGARGPRDGGVASGVPQYRIRAIESGHRSEIRPDVVHEYFRFLGIEDWVARWCRANRELAIRAGLLDPEPRGPSTRGRRTVGRGSDAKSSTR